MPLPRCREMITHFGCLIQLYLLAVLFLSSRLDRLAVPGKCER